MHSPAPRETLRRIRRLWPPLRGAVAVEAAIILPIYFLLLVGLIDVGRMLWIQAALDFASQSAARCAVVDATRCGTTAGVQSYAEEKAMGVNLSGDAFTVTAESCGIKVSATHVFTFIVPWITPEGVTLTAEACYPA